MKLNKYQPMIDEFLGMLKDGGLEYYCAFRDDENTLRAIAMDGHHIFGIILANLEDLINESPFPHILIKDFLDNLELKLKHCLNEKIRYEPPLDERIVTELEGFFEHRDYKVERFYRLTHKNDKCEYSSYKTAVEVLEFSQELLTK